MTSSVDDLIFGEPVPLSRTAEEWDAIVNRLVATLADALGVSLVAHSHEVIDGVALSCRAGTAQPFAGPLTLGISATLGIEIIQERPYVNALLFLFSWGTRLHLRGADESFAELVYRPDGRWHLNGWAEDIYGEFTSRPAP
jgi:hypothetical protein